MNSTPDTPSIPTFESATISPAPERSSWEGVADPIVRVRSALSGFLADDVDRSRVAEAFVRQTHRALKRGSKLSFDEMLNAMIQARVDHYQKTYEGFLVRFAEMQKRLAASRPVAPSVVEATP